MPVKQRVSVAWLPATINQVDISADPLASSLYGGSGSFDFGANTFAPADAVGSGTVEFIVRPLYNSSVARSMRVDFSITDGTRSMMLPLYMRQQGIPPTYEFSDGGKTLTLFSNFDRGTNLALSSANIPELADLVVGEAVTTLVVRGVDLTDDQLNGIKDHVDMSYHPSTGYVRTGLFPNLAHVSLPDFTGKIPNSTFQSCAWLQGFSAPYASEIGYLGFAYCSNLATVNVPNVETIRGEYAFGYCSELESIYLPLLTKIEGNTFKGCQKLATIYSPLVKEIENQAFQNCYAIKKLDFLPVADTFGVSAFNTCSSLETVDLPAAKTFGVGVFSDCSSLTTVSLPAAETFGNWMFAYCSSLTIVDFLPVGLKTTGTNMFYGCTSLTTVNMPVVETVGSRTFERCTSLVTVDFLPAAKMIGDNAFNNCSSLETVDLPSAVTITSRAFEACPSLTTLKLGYAEAITLPANNSLFGNNWANASMANNINLSIHSSKLGDMTYDSVTGKYIWEGYYWNSVSAY